MELEIGTTHFFAYVMGFHHTISPTLARALMGEGCLNTPPFRFSEDIRKTYRHTYVRMVSSGHAPETPERRRAIYGLTQTPSGPCYAKRSPWARLALFNPDGTLITTKGTLFAPRRPFSAPGRSFCRYYKRDFRLPNCLFGPMHGSQHAKIYVILIKIEPFSKKKIMDQILLNFRLEVNIWEHMCIFLYEGRCSYNTSISENLH